MKTWLTSDGRLLVERPAAAGGHQYWLLDGDGTKVIGRFFGEASDAGGYRSSTEHRIEGGSLVETTTVSSQSDGEIASQESRQALTGLVAGEATDPARVLRVIDDHRERARERVAALRAVAERRAAREDRASIEFERALDAYAGQQVTFVWRYTRQGTEIRDPERKLVWSVPEKPVGGIHFYRRLAAIARDCGISLDTELHGVGDEMRFYGE